MQVTAKSNIQHDGQLFEKGQTLEVNDRQAADLLAAGVIESVKGLSPTQPEEAPDRSLGTNEDVQSANEETERVASLPVDAKMKKDKLRGIALAMGLEVEKTLTGKEIYEMIVTKRGGSVEEETTPSGADSKVDSDETNGEDSTVSANGEVKTPANPSENTPAQNTTDTDKKPLK